jgi:hypothetical protein
MCYNKVNGTEVEFDFYLTLADLYDQGYPTLEHLHASPSSQSQTQEDKKESISPSPEESEEDEVCSIQ